MEKVEITIWNDYSCDNIQEIYTVDNGFIIAEIRNFEIEKINICLN